MYRFRPSSEETTTQIFSIRSPLDVHAATRKAASPGARLWPQAATTTINTNMYPRASPLIICVPCRKKQSDVVFILPLLAASPSMPPVTSALFLSSGSARQ
jgi:hypothetical protein